MTGESAPRVTRFPDEHSMTVKAKPPSQADDSRQLQSDPLALLRARGQGDYIGEPISQIEHALQCAQLAREAGGGDALIAAALLHDVGHLCVRPDTEMMPGLGVMHHEHVGADYLARAGLPRRVCELVRGHVEAKRYLVATKRAYAERLSEASQRTLALQGGPMSAAEVARFERDPLRKDKLLLRVCDERAKAPDARVPTLDTYAPLLAQLRAGSRKGGSR